MSIKQLIMKIYFNLHPTYHSTGGRVKWISADWKKVVVEIPLNWRTRNYMGTIFGGSMYSAIDPIYMIMLIRCLGPGYTVWDKAATISPFSSTMIWLAC